MLVLSYLGQSYVWCEQTHPATRLPQNLGLAWYSVAQQLKRPPVLSYASYALYNWCRLDRQQPIELGNIVLLQNFLGGADEEWFILIHIDIEYQAIPLLASLIPLAENIQQENFTQAEHHLKTIIAALEKICTTMERMPEHCDPYIYFNRVRPYIHGWKGSKALPQGLIYTGVAAYEGKPVQFKGETGAQSTIVPSLDAVFGVQHEKNSLHAHLEEMQYYMPEDHQRFLTYLRQQCNIRKLIELHKKNQSAVVDQYNTVLRLIHRFRSIHLNYAKAYIASQAERASANSTAHGTGGTPFLEYLAKHQRETELHLIT